jgi:hypothetical protein
MGPRFGPLSHSNLSHFYQKKMRHRDTEGTESNVGLCALCVSVAHFLFVGKAPGSSHRINRLVLFVSWWFKFRFLFSGDENDLSQVAGL